MHKSLALLTGLILPLLGAQVHAQTPAAPAPIITLYERHGHVTPQRSGFQHTGAGNIDVAQPSSDTVVITMAAVAVAGPHPCKDSTAAQDFDLTQCLEFALNGAKTKNVKVTMEARVIGLLRSDRKSGGTASESGSAALLSVSTEIVAVQAPAHSVSCGESLSINDHEGPVTVTIAPGKYTLHQVFHVAVATPRSFLCGKASSSEFAPDPALDPLWISYWEPFHGAAKKDFGFQVVIRVAPE